MKKLMIGMVAAMMTTLTYAQKVQPNEVPAAVKTALQKQYPTAKTVKWEKEKDAYEAGFELKETDYSVLLSAAGDILETEIEIRVDELPANARAYVTKNHPGQKIKEAAKITDAKGVVTYEAEVKGKDLIFDNTGNFVR